MKKETYYKVRKELAARAGLDARMRQEVDGDYLMLSEKDIKMIDMTFEEKLEFFSASPVTEDDISEVKQEQENKTEDPSDEDDYNEESSGAGEADSEESDNEENENEENEEMEVEDVSN